MTFVHVQWLWALFLAPVLAGVDWRGRAPRRGRTALLLGAVVGAVVLALADPIVARRDRSATTVTVVDLSGSDNDAALTRPHLMPDAMKRGPVVAFSSRAEVIPDPAVLTDSRTDGRKDGRAIAALLGRLAAPVWADDAPGGGANLAAALRLAGTCIPDGGRGVVRLISAGRSDHGDAAAEAWRLARRGVAVDVTNPGVAIGRGVAVAKVSIPASGRVGQTVRATVELEAAAAGHAVVRLVAGDGRPVSMDGDVMAGTSRLTGTVPLDRVGLTPILVAARLDGTPPAGSAAVLAEPAGGVVRAAIQVRPAAIVLLVQDADASGGADGLERTLSALLGASADVRTATPADLAGDVGPSVDAIVIADVPADHLPAAAQAAVRRAVGAGTGLLLTGAARSFGPGGYDDSQLAPLLPVRMPQEMESRDPSTTLALIVDTSGSMAGDPIDLAKAVSGLALSHLKPHDKVGIVEFYGGKRWAAPIQSAGNLSVIHRALDRLTAGGTTELYPAVEEAAFALRNVRTRSKHVLICSDGDVEDSPFAPLVRRMADDGIAVSTVQVKASHGGPNQLADIARWGNGRYYVVPDGHVLPDLSLKRAEVSLTSSLVRVPTAVIAGDDPIVRGMRPGSLGPLGGYVRTQAKPTADVLLATGDGAPLLARWRYGAGFVAALPTQLGSAMTQSLQATPAFARVLADLVRQIDSGRGDALRLTPLVRPAGVEVDVTAVGPDAARSADPLTLTLADAAGHAVRTVDAEATRFGQWDVLLPNVTAGAYRITARVGDAVAGVTGSAGVAVPPPTPLAVSNAALLTEIASFAPLADRERAALPSGHQVYFRARLWLVVVSTVLLLTHVAVRRWPRRSPTADPAKPTAAVTVGPRARHPEGVLATAALALMLIANPVRAAVPATGPSTTAPGRSLPVTRPVSWDGRIDDALKTSGSVDAVAAELAATSADTPDIVAARVRVALERGDLTAAACGLLLQTDARPGDTGLRRRLARVQELGGATEAARQTWTVAATVAAAASDGDAAADSTLRLAMLALDDRRAADGVGLLGRAAAIGPSAAQRAGVVAYLYGQDAVAARWLRQSAGSDFALWLFDGNAALAAGQTAAARDAFEQALSDAAKPADRLYAQERLIAAARQAGTLGGLADAWLADGHLPADRLLPLATVLCELRRTDTLLRWWRAASTDPARATVVLSDRFVDEVLAAARTAGDSEAAIAVCRDLLARQPDDPRRLSATLNAMRSAGHRQDADALLDDRLGKAGGDPAELERLGKLSRSLGCDAAAVRAAHRLQTFGGGPAVAGDLLEASISVRGGDRASTVNLLRRAAAVAEGHPAAVEPTVSALEAADLNDDAIALLQHSVAVDPTEPVLTRLASLLMSQRRTAEAAAILERLADSGQSEAARGQAADRLLDATAALGRLPQLVDRLHAKLAAGGGEVDVSLLVNAELRQGHTDEAVAVLRTTHRPPEAERLKQLATLYLRTGQYGAAADALRELVTAAPDDAVETLERLADTDLKRHAPDAAAAVIGEIAARHGGGPKSAELMAGLFDRLGEPVVAAGAYRRALAINGPDADDWLLWSAAMAKAGRGDAARGRLQVLCGEAPTDGVFAAAVDGLLNLNAPVPTLRAARRDAVLRVAARPHSVILYQVLADLSEELQDTAGQIAAIEAGVPVSDEERPQRLRDLMAVAIRHGRTDAAVDHGRSLLALGDDFPPALFLQLGERLLVAGRPADASGAFARAAESDPQGMASRIAALYEKYGYPSAALDTLLPVADRERNAPGYLEQVGRLSEVLGRRDAAHASYLAAMGIVGREVAADRSQPARGGASMAPPASDPASVMNRVTLGAFATARTPAEQAATLGVLRARVGDAFAGSVGEPGPTTGLNTLAALLRRSAYGLPDPDVADAFDRAVLARWPAAQRYAQQALAFRLREGYVQRGRAFGADTNVGPFPAGLPTTRPEDLARTAARLADLLAHGQDDRARTLLASLPFVAPPARPDPGSTAQPASPLQTIVTAAACAGEPDLATKWAVFWMDATISASRRPPAAKQTADRAPSRADAFAAEQADRVRLTGGYTVLAASWPHLDTDGRARLLARFVGLLRECGPSRTRGSMAESALQAATEVPVPVADRNALADMVLDGTTGVAGSGPSATLAGLVLLLPPADRADMVRRAMGRLPTESRLALLTGVVAAAGEPLDGPTLAAIASAAKAVPPGQVPDAIDWSCNAVQRAVLVPLAEATLRTADDPASPYAPAALASAAVAFATAGDVPRADAAATRAIERLASVPKAASDPTLAFHRRPLLDRLALLRVATGAMSADARARALAAVEATLGSVAVAPADVTWARLVRSVLLDAGCRRGDALAELRTAYAADPTDAVVGRAYVDRLAEDGQWAELVSAFAGAAAGGGNADRYSRAVNRGWVNLNRWREARASSAASPTSAVSFDLAAAETGTDPEMRTAFRAVLLAARTSPDGVSWSELPGRGELGRPQATLAPRFMSHLVAEPEAADDVLGTIRVPPGGNAPTVTRLLDLLTPAAARPDVFAALSKRIDLAVTTHSVGGAERQLIAGLAVQPARAIPPAWVAELWPAALADPSGVELRRLARALDAQRLPGSAAALRWADALTNGMPQSAGRLDRPRVPSVFDWFEDRPLAEGVADLAGRDPAAAEALLATFVRTGRLAPRFVRTAAVWARLAAERGDNAAYAQRLDACLSAWTWQRRGPGPTVSPGGGPVAQLDLRTALPTHVPVESCRRALLDGVAAGLQKLADVSPSDTAITHELALLGQWADTHGDRDAAERLFGRALALATRQGVGEQQLWVADLAAQLGHKQVAMDLECQLLEGGCLPATRIDSLLARLRDGGEGSRADRLATVARAYRMETTPPGTTRPGQAEPSLSPEADR